MSGEKIADSLSLEDARRVIDAAVAKAVEIGVPQDVAVVDTGGHLKAGKLKAIAVATNTAASTSRSTRRTLRSPFSARPRT